jgi:hypothetical protein
MDLFMGTHATRKILHIGCWGPKGPKIPRRRPMLDRFGKSRGSRGSLRTALLVLHVGGPEGPEIHCGSPMLGRFLGSGGAPGEGSLRTALLVGTSFDVSPCGWHHPEDPSTRISWALGPGVRSSRISWVWGADALQIEGFTAPKPTKSVDSGPPAQKPTKSVGLDWVCALLTLICVVGVVRPNRRAYLMVSVA